MSTVPIILQQRRMTYPRPVTTIKQIEVTSRCNLACTYCPHPTMKRTKEDMTMETFEKALALVRHYRAAGTQRELSITGIGEALLHPYFVIMINLAREALGWDHPLVFSTNGLLLTDEVALAIKDAKPFIFVSLHRPEASGPAIEVAKRHGLLAGMNHAFVTSSLDWAGQVKWHVSAPRIKCEFLKEGWGVVLADGAITTCCIDAEKRGTIGTVDTPPEELQMKPYSLCSSCNQEVP